MRLEMRARMVGSGDRPAGCQYRRPISLRLLPVTVPAPATWELLSRAQVAGGIGYLERDPNHVGSSTNLYLGRGRRVRRLQAQAESL